LYKTEIIEKEKTEESVRQQVSELLQQMRQEQKEKMAKSRVCEKMSCEDNCPVHLIFSSFVVW
jgi:hypothetical protein